MLPENGLVIATPDVPPAAWANALGAERSPLVLAPGSTRGWFGGHTLVACDPAHVRTEHGDAYASAGEVLERALASVEPLMAVALMSYDGPTVTALFPRGLVLTSAGWRLWGDWDGEIPPEPLEPVPAADDTPLAAAVARDMEADAYVDAVLQVHEAVRRGDVYVLNLTYRMEGRPTAPAAVAFASLLARSNADMAACWLRPGAALASASPERFISLEAGEVEVHPIKGTRPRGADAAADRALARGLSASIKERSEHVMVVDMERNDLGRVCRPGSVRVDPLLEVFTTPYCHQMVSRVRGSLAPGTGVAELLAATFPCGSVTGAPKISAMTHIRELERSPRGAYTGSLVVAANGSLDSSVLIRTMEYDGELVRYGTGGGITIDSDPVEEWMETLTKAGPFLGDGTPPVALRETCRVVGDRLPLWLRHLSRLASGGCGPSLLRETEARVTVALTGRAPDDGLARLRVTVGPDRTVDVTLDAYTTSLDVAGGPTFALVTTDAPPLPPGAAKPGCREPWDRARAATDADQAVLIGADGLVIDGSTASIWSVRDGVATTPPAPPAVAGVARGILLAKAREHDIEARVAPLTAAELDGSDEVFFTNAIGGAVAARERGGPVSVRAASLFEAAWSAEA